MTIRMDDSVYSSPIRTYTDNYHKMRVTQEVDGSDPKDLCSLGMVDLDLSISPDAFGLRAFDNKKPLTRMLPGSSLADVAGLKDSHERVSRCCD